MQLVNRWNQPPIGQTGRLETKAVLHRNKVHFLEQKYRENWEVRPPVELMSVVMSNTNST